MTRTRDELYDDVSYLRNLLMRAATSNGVTDKQYKEYRDRVLDSPIPRSALPKFLIRCPSRSDFWEYIKNEFDNWRDRREFIRKEFEPVFNAANISSKSPGDRTIAEAMSKVDAEYVEHSWEKALERRSRDPEGAITAARALLETVCKHILDDAGVKYSNTADIPALYSQVATELRISPNQQTEQVLRKILGGCQTVVEGLGNLRNQMGDAHGKGREGLIPEQRHAELAVNLAGAIAMFLLEESDREKAAS